MMTTAAEGVEDWRRHYVTWTNLLLSGRFSVLVHGDGSKRAVLEDYVEGMLKDCNCAVFEGYKGCVTAKLILDTINAEFKLKVKSRGVPLCEYATQVARAVEEAGWVLFVLVHNLDGPGLRQPSQQEALAVLSRSVHLLASVDSKRAGLMWEPSTKDAFNWVCTEVNTHLEKNADEMAGPTTSKARSHQAHTHASLEVFWRATTANQHKILEQLAVSATVAGVKTATEDLFTLPDLCANLKKEFATTNETVLRTQLTEFIDHHIIELDKHGAIILTVNRDTLVTFLESKLSSTANDDDEEEEQEAE